MHPVFVATASRISLRIRRFTGKDTGGQQCQTALSWLTGARSIQRPCRYRIRQQALVMSANAFYSFGGGIA